MSDAGADIGITGEFIDRLHATVGRAAGAASPRGGSWSIRHMMATMVPLLTILAVLQMVSGTVLESFEAALLTQPALMILVPVQIGTAGNLGSIMCSRLSTEVHLGTFELSASNPAVRANGGGIVLLGVTVYALVGVAAWAISRALGGTIAFIEVMTIALGSGMVLITIVLGLSVVAVTLSFHFGVDPDDTTIPVVTNVADITGVLVLFGFVRLVLG